MRVRVACIFVTVTLFASGCSWRTHPLEEGDYTLAQNKVIRDDCALAQNPDVTKSIGLAIDGDQVRINYSLFQTQLIGQFLEVSEKFTVDGSQANLEANVGGRDCLLDLVNVHVDGATQSPTQFTGSLSVDLQQSPAGPCDCKTWLTFTATRAP